MTNASEVMPAGDLGEKVHRSPRLAPSTSEATIREQGHKRGCLLSGIICTNILFLVSALVSSTVFNPKGVSSIHLQGFLSALILLTTAWIIYYMGYVANEDRAVLYKDAHAGPIWLRGGLVLFGGCSLIMDVFKIANYVGYMHCESPMMVVYPAVQAVFILVQTYFLWFHAKDCVQLQRNVTRCGFMLCLSTNLVVWMTTVTEESLHQTVYPDERNKSHMHSVTAEADNSNGSCKCSHTACGIFKQAYYYLYPFNIEYSLFAATMMYVMWKNVGRLMDAHAHHQHTHRLHLKGILAGPVGGIIMLVTGIATFVYYDVKVSENSDEALMLHYMVNTVVVSLMSLTTLVGCVIYWLDERNHVLEKNPSRSLDVGLLLGASLGSFLICYFNVVAVIASGKTETLNAVNLACSLVTILQLILQNVFIIEGLHREPFKETHASPIFSNPHALHANQEVHQRQSTRRSTVVIITAGMHMPVALGLCWKRRVLKEICVFLLLCNILLWIMPAFGARPQFNNPLGFDFYSVTTWAAVVNIGLPFSIFYRMHSVASLFEVYLIS
uniref:Otopetrin 2 n=2 Tax=Paramormyrops kingsleyae TaxID=1676925 RepID=A0A3B3R4A3_9TELE|nr:otopetrin-2-like [Paramormyrops kingsleyae]